MVRGPLYLELGKAVLKLYPIENETKQTKCHNVNLGPPALESLMSTF